LGLVSKNSIWREHCEKELSHTQLNTNFSVSNIKKMSILPEKPNYVVPSTKGECPIQRPQ
jgi:hypothetical protein